MDTYAKKLYESHPLREPVVRTAIESMRLPRGSRGLDAGCGIGLPATMLARAVGPTGHVTGLDLSPDLLDQAEKIVADLELSERISFRQGNANRIPFDADAFDWAWSMDCVGYHPADPLPMLKELARVVKPGGRIALLAYSSQLLLPGHPLLEARLNATAAGIAPFAADGGPERHFHNALSWLREMGLEQVGAKTFVGDAHAPLDEDVRRALLSLIEMRWEEARSEVSPEDWKDFQRLSRPDSPDLILNRPDYYAFFTYSMFHGRTGKHE
ncbi:MAG: class I SAM-dependent methyltransferase [Proteobacteria bacterium]|nr:class I SAM-dependent methyltransferase [Pseudomonadota bacterium]